MEPLDFDLVRRFVESANKSCEGGFVCGIAVLPAEMDAPEGTDWQMRVSVLRANGSLWEHTGYMLASRGMTANQALRRMIEVAREGEEEQGVEKEEEKEAEKGTVDQKGSFGWALQNAREGKRVRRAGWNGKGMWITVQVPDEGSKMEVPYLYMRGADGKLFPWNPNNLDLFGMDWEEVPSEGTAA